MYALKDGINMKGTFDKAISWTSTEKSKRLLTDEDITRHCHSILQVNEVTVILSVLEEAPQNCSAGPIGMLCTRKN